MDCKRVGKLIYTLRRDKRFTQKKLAEQMNLSDRTISKWERGLGCPDVSLLPELSKILEVDIGSILSGSLETNDTDGGNMKKIKFYRCPACGNVLTATGEADISCCGRRLAPLKANKADQAHQMQTDIVEDDYYITFQHEMTKQHYIGFIACVSWDRVLLVRLYPEQGSEVRIPKLAGKPSFYFGCSEHGLFEKD